MKKKPVRVKVKRKGVRPSGRGKLAYGRTGKKRVLEDEPGPGLDSRA